MGSGTINFALTLAGLAVWAEINRQAAVEQKRLTERAFDRASRSSNELVGELVQRFQNQEGIPQALIVDLLKKAAALVDGLASGRAANRSVERALGVALVELSEKFLSQKDVDQALDAAQRAVTIFRRLLATAPADRGSQEDLIVALDRLGNALVQPDPVAASAAYEEGLSLARGLVGDGQPNVTEQHLPLLWKKRPTSTGILILLRPSLCINRVLLSVSTSRTSNSTSDLKREMADVMRRQGDKEKAIETLREESRSYVTNCSVRTKEYRPAKRRCYRASEPRRRLQRIG